MAKDIEMKSVKNSSEMNTLIVSAEDFDERFSKFMIIWITCLMT